MSSGQYILYDIASREPCSTWTPNPWKTRLLFNFKGIDFKTKWLHYPEIKPTLESHVTPNEHGIPYSIPTIITPDGEYIMDSRAITEYVESQRAQPSLHLDNNIVEEVEFLWASYMGAIKPIFLNQVPKRILPDESLEYWYATRKEMAGMPVEELEEKKGGESAWDEAEMALREVSALLKKNKKGPFFLGDVVSYADLIWGSVLLFSERIGPDFFGEALKRSGDGQSHLDLLNAIRPWSV